MRRRDRRRHGGSVLAAAAAGDPAVANSYSVDNPVVATHLGFDELGQLIQHGLCADAVPCYVFPDGSSQCFPSYNRSTCTWTFDGTSWTEVTAGDVVPVATDVAFVSVPGEGLFTYGGRADELEFEVADYARVSNDRLRMWSDNLWSEPAVDGVQLLWWTGRGWTPLAENASAEPAALQSTVDVDAGILRSAGMTSVAVVPRGNNEVAYATVTVDYVELRVRYRHP